MYSTKNAVLGCLSKYCIQDVGSDSAILLSAGYASVGVVCSVLHCEKDAEKLEKIQIHEKVDKRFGRQGMQGKAERTRHV